jgi:hypothetical protein
MLIWAMLRKINNKTYVKNIENSNIQDSVYCLLGILCVDKSLTCSLVRSSVSNVEVFGMDCVAK